jgi:hypothetical protein
MLRSRASPSLASATAVRSSRPSSTTINSSSVVVCASTELTRETQTSGTFESTAWTVTILAIDIPKGALVAARENVNNMGLANAVVTEPQVAPYLGWFDWFLDILSVRRARLRGTWGFEK